MTKHKSNDPQAKREAQRYERPIASREYLLQILSEAGAPLHFEDIVGQLKYTDEEQLVALHRRLRAMERDAQIFLNRKDQYAIVEAADLVPGTVLGHPDGFGFLRPDDGSEDLFLAPKQMRSLLPGDRVLARVSGIDRRGRREGKLVEILQRGLTELVGSYYLESGVGFVIPQNKRIAQDVIIPDGAQGKAVHGDIVIVQITDYPSKRSHAIGRISEVLGHELSPSMHIEIAVRNFALPHAWSDELLAELELIADEIPAAEIDRRLDVRDLPLVTIDGEDAKDFDDAVYCQATDKGWKLYVAIADVSSYVKPDTALDAEAFDRGTSVYFPERVVPMLPERLSNGLCSINPDVDRLCMLCEMDITKKGKLSRYRFHEAVMRSHARLTYTQVAAMLLGGDKDLCHQYETLLPHLRELHALYRQLVKARRNRGAIDFDSDETRFSFGPDGAVEAIVPVVRNDAHRLIEECMITANIAAARFLEEHKIPGLYRVHAGPAEDDLTALRDYLAELGLSLRGGDNPQPKHYAELLDSVRERPDAHVIETVMLRSLKQAMYEAGNTGHFGLALSHYAHFTSPIRRYPDLLVHRAIRHIVQGGKPRDYRYSKADMEGAGLHCSNMARRADEAGWDVDEVLKCEYMQRHVGDELMGTVAGVTNFGLFLDIDDFNISGLVHVTSLGQDYFHHDPTHHRLTGDHSRIVFKLGDRMQVRVIRVNVEERKIDLEPVALPKALTNMPIKQPGKSVRRGKKRRRR